MVFGKRGLTRVFLWLLAGGVLSLQAASDPPLDVCVRVTADWGWGFRARIAVRNSTTAPVSGWGLVVETRSLIGEVHGARVAWRSDGRVLLLPAGAEPIPPGGSVSIEIGGAPGIAELVVSPTRGDFPPARAGGPSGAPLIGSVDVAISGEPGRTTAILRNQTWRRLRNWEIEFDPTAAAFRGMVNRPARPGTRRISAPGLLSEIGLAPMRSVAVPLQPGPVGPLRPPSPRAVHALIAPEFPATLSFYARALRLSLLFYEAQRSGRLPPQRRVRWRGDSALTDGMDVGLDLTGGYYDAGDHVKFVFPMAAAMTVLAWGGIEYGDGFRDAGEWNHFLSALRWGTDWLMKAHPARDVFVGQIGEAVVDHAVWAPPERMPVPRRTFLLTPENPGTEVAAEASAALAAASVVFRDADPGYARRLRAASHSLFEFANRYRGSCSQAITEAERHYPSRNGYIDELAWAAAWNYAATGHPALLKQAGSSTRKRSIPHSPGQGSPGMTNVPGWRC